MLVDQENASVPLFDTTRIHAEKAIEMALNSRKLAACEDAPQYALENGRLGTQPISATPKRKSEQGGR